MNIRIYCAMLLIMNSSLSESNGNTFVQMACQDLAARLQVPVEQVTVISQTEKTWSDGSLGCPRKGMVYKQVLSNGSQLVLGVAERRYYYHAGAGKPYFYCAKPAEKNGPPIGSPPNEAI